MADGLIDGVDDTDVEDEIEVFGVKVLFGYGDTAGSESEAIGAAAELDVELVECIGEGWPEEWCGFAVNEECFGGIANAGPLAFAVDDDVAGRVFIGGLVDEDMANAVKVFDDGHGCFPGDSFDQRPSAAGW